MNMIFLVISPVVEDQEWQSVRRKTRPLSQSSKFLMVPNIFGQETERWWSKQEKQNNTKPRKEPQVSPPGPAGGSVRPDRVQIFLFSNPRVQVYQCFTVVVFDPVDPSLTHQPLQYFTTRLIRLRTWDFQKTVYRPLEIWVFLSQFFSSQAPG